MCTCPPMPTHSCHRIPLYAHAHAHTHHPQMMYVFFSSYFSCLMSDGDTPCHPLPQHNDNTCTYTHAHLHPPPLNVDMYMPLHAHLLTPLHAIASHCAPLHAHPPTPSHTHQWPVQYTAWVMGCATHGTAGGMRHNMGDERRSTQPRQWAV